MQKIWPVPVAGRTRSYMVGWLLRATFSTVALALVAYAVVAVPVGRRTLFEHASAISKTRPAQELATDVEAAAATAFEKARARLKTGSSSP